MYEDDLYESIKGISFYVENSPFIVRVEKFLQEPIETENPQILRAQISSAYSYIGFLIKLKAKAEGVYRLSKKESALTLEKKSKPGEAILDGDSAPYRFVRDLLEGYLKGIEGKISASKAVLNSLDMELRSMPRVQ